MVTIDEVIEGMGKTLAGGQVKFKLSPSLFGRTVKIPYAGPAEKLFDNLVALNQKGDPRIGYFYSPGSSEKAVHLFDRTRDTRQETKVPLRKSFWESYNKAVELSFATNSRGELMRYDQDDEVVILSGPGPVVAQLRKFAESMRSSAMRETMVFKLDYANASDEEFSAERITGEGAKALKTQGIDDRLRRIFDFENTEKADDLPTKFTKPYLYVDKRSNNIIIVDHPENYSEYEKVIKKLDRKPEMVEITAAIIDLEVSSSFDWKSEFQVKGRERSDSNEQYVAGFGAESEFGRGPDGLPKSTSVADKTGLNSATVLIGSNYEILSKVKALEGAGKAKLLSQPSVVAIENHPARVTDKTAAFNSRDGTRQGKFYKIESGLDLGVLPRIVDAENGDGTEQPRMLHLMVDIGDGMVFEGALETTTNRIVTQVTLRDGQSLLVGGRFRDQQEKGTQNVPLLGNLPVLGLPLRSDSVTTGKFQRLYLITPRIVKAGEASRRQQASAQALVEESSRAAAASAATELRAHHPSVVGSVEPESAPSEPKRRKIWRKPVRSFLGRKK